VVVVIPVLQQLGGYIRVNLKLVEARHGGHRSSGNLEGRPGSFSDAFLFSPSSPSRPGYRIMVEITILKRTWTEAVVTQRKFFKKTARGKVIKGMKPLDFASK